MPHVSGHELLNVSVFKNVGVTRPDQRGPCGLCLLFFFLALTSILWAFISQRAIFQSGFTYNASVTFTTTCTRLFLPFRG